MITGRAGHANAANALYNALSHTLLMTHPFAVPFSGVARAAAGLGTEWQQLDSQQRAFSVPLHRHPRCRDDFIIRTSGQVYRGVTNKTWAVWSGVPALLPFAAVLPAAVGAGMLRAR